MSQKYDLNVTLLLIQLLSQLTPKTKQHSEECCFSGGPDGTYYYGIYGLSYFILII